jgi:GT2 family glycosyltransferase
VTAVAAVIGNFNGEHVLGDCLESLERQSLPPNEVLVVDGSSSDGSVELARSRGVRVIVNDNRGLGALYNRGVAATAAPLVVLLNNDVALDARCVEELAAPFGDASVFAADARQLDWAGASVIHARTTLTLGAMTREHLPGLHLDDRVPAEAVAETVCANGAAMAVRREMMSALGGFDETFFMEWEDLDLCWRAWLRGWRTVYVPRAVVRHRVGAVTTADVRPRRAASSHHNLMRFALKCLPTAAAVRVVAGELLRLPRHRRAVAAALAATAGELPEIARERRRLAPTREVYDRLLAL